MSDWNPAQYLRFEAELLSRCEEAYPLRADGKPLFPFQRLFFIAYR